MMRIFAIISLFAIILPSHLQAQDTLGKRKQDSVLNVSVNKQINSIERLAAERIADSLRRADLELQMAALSETEQQKRAGLLKELNALKQRDSLQLMRQKHQVDSLRQFVKGFPVAPFADTLFYVYTRQGSFTSSERAAAVSSRIKKICDEVSFSADSLKIVTSEQTVDVIFKSSLLISVSDQDALWANTDKRLLAEKIKNVIKVAVIKYRDETSWATIAKEGLLALLVILLVVLIIYGINRLFRLVLSKTNNPTAWYSRGIHLRNYQLLKPEQQRNILHGIIRGLKWLAIILVIYLALPVLFGIFPVTRNISGTLLGYVVTPLKKILLSLWEYVPNLITIIIIVIAFRYVLVFLRYLKNEIAYGKLTIPGFYPDWANPTYQIARVLILAFMLIVIFPYMPGSDSQIFKGVSVFLGVLFTFGSAGALSNVVAGLVLTYMRAFILGDRVKIGDVTGDIVGKTLLVTRIRTIQNEIVSIPNSTVLNSHTLNYSSDAPEKGLIVYTTVTIGYDVPWRQVHQLLIDAALNTEMIDKEPVPYVLQTSLDDNYVSYRLNAYTKQPNKQAVIYSGLHQNIQDEFNKAGVEIMSPHYRAIRDGNTATIPPEYLPDDYEPPTFSMPQQPGKPKDE